MGAVVWIFSARHDAHPFGGMLHMGIGWPDHRNNTLSYSKYCKENCRGQSKVHSHAAKRGETIAHIQNRSFPFNIGCSVVGPLPKIFVPYCSISGFINMAWCMRRRVFACITYRVTLPSLKAYEDLKKDNYIGNSTRQGSFVAIKERDFDEV